MIRSPLVFVRYTEKGDISPKVEVILTEKSYIAIDDQKELSKLPVKRLIREILDNDNHNTMTKEDLLPLKKEKLVEQLKELLNKNRQNVSSYLFW